MKHTVKQLLALLIGAVIVGTTACSAGDPIEQTASPHTWYTIANKPTTASDTTAQAVTDTPATVPITSPVTAEAEPATTPEPVTTANKPTTALAPITTTSEQTPATQAPETATPPTTDSPQAEYDYLLNSQSMVFHTPDCGSGKKIKAENRVEFSGRWEDLIAKGYSPCGNCDPAGDVTALPATTKTPQTAAEPQGDCDFVLNTKSMKFHQPDCGSAKTIKDENRAEFSGGRDELIAAGYSPCGNCDP